MTKFKHIDKADQYKADKTQVDAWRNQSTAEKQADFKATQLKTGNLKTAITPVLGYIRPLDIAVAKKIFLKVELPTPGTAVAGKTQAAAALINGLRTLLASYATATKPTGADNILLETRGIRGFVPAKIVVTQKGDAVDGVTSRMTGRTYSYVQKNSVSCAVGRSVDADTLRSILTGVQSNLEGTSPTIPGARASATPEKGVLIEFTVAA